MRMILMIGTAAFLSATFFAMAETATRLAVSVQPASLTGTAPVLPGHTG